MKRLEDEDTDRQRNAQLKSEEFVFIGAAAATGSSNCLRTHLVVARELGASNEQLLLAIIIGASIAGTSALSRSLRVYEEFKEKNNCLFSFKNF